MIAFQMYDPQNWDVYMEECRGRWKDDEKAEKAFVDLVRTRSIYLYDTLYVPAPRPYTEEAQIAWIIYTLTFNYTNIIERCAFLEAFPPSRGFFQTPQSTFYTSGQFQDTAKWTNDADGTKRKQVLNRVFNSSDVQEYQFAAMDLLDRYVSLAKTRLDYQSDTFSKIVDACNAISKSLYSSAAELFEELGDGLVYPDELKDALCDVCYTLEFDLYHSLPFDTVSFTTDQWWLNKYDDDPRGERLVTLRSQILGESLPQPQPSMRSRPQISSKTLPEPQPLPAPPSTGATRPKPRLANGTIFTKLASWIRV